jgi:hypothetical protein
MHIHIYIHMHICIHIYIYTMHTYIYTYQENTHISRHLPIHKHLDWNIYIHIYRASVWLWNPRPITRLQRSAVYVRMRVAKRARLIKLLTGNPKVFGCRWGTPTVEGSTRVPATDTGLPTDVALPVPIIGDGIGCALCIVLSCWCWVSEDGMTRCMLSLSYWLWEWFERLIFGFVSGVNCVMWRLSTCVWWCVCVYKVLSS